MRCFREYNKDPKTVKWKHFDATRRILSVNRYSLLVEPSGSPVCIVDGILDIPW